MSEPFQIAVLMIAASVIGAVITRQWAQSKELVALRKELDALKLEHAKTATEIGTSDTGIRGRLHDIPNSFLKLDTRVTVLETENKISGLLTDLIRSIKGANPNAVRDPPADRPT